MSLFKNLSNDASIKQDQDNISNNQYGPWETNVYDVVIDLVYLDESPGGAINTNFVFKTQDGNTLKQTIYISSGKEKGQLNYSVRADGGKYYLPGFVTANDIALLTVGNELLELEPEMKVISIYNKELSKVAPTKREVLTELLGQEVTLAVKRVTKDKYNSPGETVTINEIAKVFRTSDKKTSNEIKSESEATFYEKWKEKNAGKDVIKTGEKEPVKPTEDKPPVKKLIFNK